MQNLFDSIQKAAYGIVASTFGYSATWQPSEGGDLLTSVVLYKDATEKTGLSDIDYTVERYTMEYQSGDFPGLKIAVDGGNTERVTLETSPGVFQPFYVRRLETKYDGKTVVAILSPTS